MRGTSINVDGKQFQSGPRPAPATPAPPAEPWPAPRSVGAVRNKPHTQALCSLSMLFARGWSEFEPLKDVVDNDRVGVGAGAYVIRVRDRPIHRAVGVDEIGILDIGESGRLRARLRTFLKCASNPDVFGHMAGWRYAYLRFARHFPLKQLDVRWINVGNKAAAYGEEGRLLAAYVAKYFELPPLNYKFNWQSEG